MPATLPAGKPPPPSLRAQRLAKRSIPGQTYVLTLPTLYRRPVFRDDEAARAVCRIHTAHWPWRDSSVSAWVLMPDHWHGLVTLGERDTLSTLVGRFKAITSRAVDDRHLVNGWLWGRGFSDRLLPAGEDLLQAARYLVANPLRAGLVGRLGDYPYWNAAWLEPAEH
ncbi:MAG: transposase [Arenimonas sp.]|uniref:REP-associated tyrosine transposase n=1 Tax=Arenimonas sp. TaxID=1872635 RepID=UPI0025BBDF9F|nr:transposase [Arenimonas sp.]MBW8369323.1 transposase [Arenimonas sp.]